MAKKYIKSYSNYVLKTKHQQTNNGTIYERDITTIGGRDQFAKGQVPIYKTGNFVITINNDISDYRKTSDKDWYRSDEGEVWTINTLKHYEKDEKSSYDEKIEIKKDYLDLRDYAYYGSCSELIRVSINDIIKNYPGELFFPYETLYVSKDGDGVEYTEDAAINSYGKEGYTVERSGIKGYYTSMENRKTRKVKDSCGNIVTINSVSLIDELTSQEEEELKLGIPYTREFKYLTDKYGNIIEEKSLSLIDNPFEINMHYNFVPDGENPLRYFADGGVNNYVAYIKDSIDSDWIIDEEHEYLVTIEDIIFDGLGEKEERNEIFEASGDLCPNNNCVPEMLVNLLGHGNVEKIADCIIDCVDPGKYLGKITLCFRKTDYSFKTTPGLLRDKNNKPIDVCCDGTLDFDGEGTNEGNVKIDSFRSLDCLPENKLIVYIFMGNNNEIKYFVEDFDAGSKINVSYDNTDDNCAQNSASVNTDFSGGFKWQNFIYRIRPNKEIVENFFKNLDDFEKVLLNRHSEPIYTATFELLGDNDYGMYTYTKQFTFPTTYGGYNLGSNSVVFSNYVTELSKIGEYYDELFTDNMWRSMTHESIKNFDWTYTRHYTPGEEEPYTEAGTKIQKVIRLFGREFDEIKTYIDAIDNLNTITYNNINNLPDYFFTDKLDEYGWDIKLVNPLELSEFVAGHDNVPIDIHTLFPKKYDEEGNEISTEEAEKLNYFYDTPSENDVGDRNKITIQRVFNQKNVNIVPYSCNNITTIRETKYSKLHPESVETYSESTFSFDNSKLDPCIVDGSFSGKSNSITGEFVRNGYHNDCGNIIRIYCDNSVYTPSDVNSEFMKRFLLNSAEIWRHKGTIEGIEMLLSLFGMKSKNRVYTDEKYFINKNGNGECLSLTNEGEKYYKNYVDTLYNTYDYDIKEYTLFTTREVDNWVETKNMYELDWVNSTKLISYNNTAYKPYGGLPVSYKNVITNENKKVRYLYPYFNTAEKYDGNPYYQMNGGWMQKKPFMFDIKNNIIPEDFDSENRKNKSLFTETVKNIKCVRTIQDLLSNPSLVNNSGDICQVEDISGRFAIIDGYVYPLLTELADNESSGNSFFYASIYNNSLSIGNALFTDYVIISNPYFENNKQRIELADDYYNNREIKIYILQNDNGYDIDVYSKNTSISTFTVFENGKYMEGENYTNYFILNNIDYYNELSVLGWQQLKTDEYEYYRLSSITDYRKGNNPHTGHMNYDNGHKYLTYFQKVFKHVIDNDLIDYRQYAEADLSYIDDMNSFGFKNLIDEDECESDYDKFLREDNKCHFFGKILSKVDNDCNDSRKELTCFKKRETANSSMFEKNSNGDCVTNEFSYKLTDIFRKNIILDYKQKPKLLNLKYGSVYNELGESGEYNESNIDNVTNQIVNTKRMEIEFFIKNKHEYSKEWLEEVKYIDSVILPYLTQMIPSTVIWRVKYTTRDKEDWKTTETECKSV